MTDQPLSPCRTMTKSAGLAPSCIIRANNVVRQSGARSPQCSTRRRIDGGTEYFHSFLGTSVGAAGHTQVLPLPAELFTPQDGAEKHDCFPPFKRSTLFH